MAQRITRAKQRIKESGAQFRLPVGGEWLERLRWVLHVLYLLFNEGYTSSSGAELHRSDLSGEAIRLTRAIHALLPDSGEVGGLLALMILTARRPARTGSVGELIPLAEQDRSRWDQDLIIEGVALAVDAFARPPLGEINCRLRSRHCTTRRNGPRTPTGRRSWRSTTCWSSCLASRW